MSVNLMSAIFETEFFDIKDENGNVTKASTAKLVLLSMADHANDEGEGAYPSIERLCKKTALSPQTIRNTFDALRFNGIIALQGKSKYGTNNHTINTKSFPKAIEKEPVYLTLYPLDPLISEATPSNQYHDTLYPLDPNHPLTIIESPSELLEIEKQANRKVDAMLDMANFPGPKREIRLNAILSYIGSKLGVMAESRKWQEFAKFVDNRQLNCGESLERFIEWMTTQKGYDIQYWPPAKMQDLWPQAFMNEAISLEDQGWK